MGWGGGNVTDKVIYLTVIGILIALYSVALDKMSLGKNEEKGDNTPTLRGLAELEEPEQKSENSRK